MKRRTKLAVGNTNSSQHFSSQSWDRYTLLHGRIYRESANTVASAPQPVNLSKSGPKNSPFLFSFFFLLEKKESTHIKSEPFEIFFYCPSLVPFYMDKIPIDFFFTAEVLMVPIINRTNPLFLKNTHTNQVRGVPAG